MYTTSWSEHSSDYRVTAACNIPTATSESLQCAQLLGNSPESSRLEQPDAGDADDLERFYSTKLQDILEELEL